MLHKKHISHDQSGGKIRKKAAHQTNFSAISKPHEIFVSC